MYRAEYPSASIRLARSRHAAASDAADVCTAKRNGCIGGTLFGARHDAPVRMRTVVMVSAAALMAACGSSAKKAASTETGKAPTTVLGAAVTTPATAGPGCQVAPDRIPNVSWLPADFPMPAG